MTPVRLQRNRRSAIIQHMTRRTSTKLASTEPATITMAAKSGRKLYDDEAVYEFVNWLTRFPDPDEVLRKAGLTRASLRTLEHDDEIAQCLDTRREALLATPWRLEPQQPRLNKWLTKEIEPHMHDIICCAFNAVLYGYSVAEVVYARSEGRIGISHIGEKPLEWFEPRYDGKLIYRPLTGDEVECQSIKFILCRSRPTYRQPYGESLLSRLYWTAFFRSHGRKFWAKFLERFGEPLLIGKVRDQQKFVNDLLSLGVGAGLPIGPDDNIEHISITQAGEFERFETAMSKSIQKLILGQTLTSDVGKTGSYAAAKVHQQVQETKRNADIRMVTYAAQQLVNNLAALNGIANPPEFVMCDDTGLELERAQRDKLHYEQGVRFTPDYYIDRFDYREGDFAMAAEGAQDQPPDQQAEPLSSDAEDAQDQADANMAAQTHNMRPRKVQFTPQQQAIEDAGSAIIANAPPPIAESAILAAVKAATDPADLAVRLSMLLDEQNPRFAELLARANVAANILGYVVAEKEGPQPKNPKPENQQLIQHFHMPQGFGAAPPVTVNLAPQDAPPAPQVQVDVHMPEQAAPTVNVAAPVVQMEAPIVNVQPADVMVNNVYPTKAVQTVERDPETQEITATVTTYI